MKHCSNCIYEYTCDWKRAGDKDYCKHYVHEDNEIEPLFCIDWTCPYYKEGKKCEAAAGCPGYARPLEGILIGEADV